jgi:hypothetical protein
MFKSGDFVEFDGLLAVVVGTFESGLAPENHLALWFGEPCAIRKSEGGSGGLTPQIWTVPLESCLSAVAPFFNH